MEGLEGSAAIALNQECDSDFTNTYTRSLARMNNDGWLYFLSWQLTALL